MDHPLYIRGVSDLDRVPGILDEGYGEFCFSDTFNPAFVDALCRCGYLPMAEAIEGGCILLIKLHRERCVLSLPGAARVPKKVKKRAAGLRLTVDRAFTDCLDAIDRRHPDNWIHPPLAEVFLRMHHERAWTTRFHSIEIWEGDRLAAGEIGFAVGASYCSLSGFYRKSGAGTIQLHATARLLERAGFLWWDLGMELEYKTALGAGVLPRHEFLRRFNEISVQNARLETGPVDVGALLS